MGDHYIPQYYLKGFTGNDDLIWVYEKGNQRKFVTTIKNIAQENDFYSREIEQYLANEVEAPANQVLLKIRSREPLLSSDKLALSTYMVALLKRAPDSKRRLKQRAPEITKKMRADIDSKIMNIITAEPAKTEYLERKRSAIHGILDKYAKDPPKKVWLNTIPPDTASKPLELMQQMTWLFLVYESGRVFITSDNPVFFFAGLGIGKAESEITFPISSNIILWANWRSDLQDGYYKATMQVVKEMNRRTASKTTRYIYHAEDERWIPDFMNKKNQQLHMLL